MTDLATPKKKRSLILPIAAGVVALAVAGFLASRAGLDKALVKQQVDDFIARLHEQGAQQGRDITLTYADLEVAGGLTNKHVVMKAPVLTVKPLASQAAVPAADKKATDALRITTPQVAIYPDAVDLSALTVKAADAINFAGEEAPEKSLLKVTPSAPIAVSVANIKKGDVPYSEISASLPPKLEMVYLRETQAEGKEEETPTLVPVYETLSVTMDAGGSTKTSLAEDGSGLGTAATSYRNIVFTPEKAPDQALTIAEISGNWSNSLNEKKLNVITAALKFGPVTSANADAPYQPVALELDASFEGAMPKTPESIANTQSQDSVMTLKTFSLTTKDASLKASANFTANTADVLPVGTANITLTNAPYVLAELKKHELLSPANEQLVTLVLERVTGTPVAQLTDVVIPIERARAGAFKVGNSTFEELFALLLQHAMAAGKGKIVPAPSAEPAPVMDGSTGPQGALEMPHVPQLPSADKPKLNPIEIPDQSVRG